MLTITLTWWMLPIALVLCGAGLGTFINSRAKGGYFDLVPLGAFLVFVVFCLVAAGVCIGHWIS